MNVSVASSLSLTLLCDYRHLRHPHLHVKPRLVFTTPSLVFYAQHSFFALTSVSPTVEMTGLDIAIFKDSSGSLVLPRITW